MDKLGGVGGGGWGRGVACNALVNRLYMGVEGEGGNTADKVWGGELTALTGSCQLCVYCRKNRTKRGAVYHGSAKYQPTLCTGKGLWIMLKLTTVALSCPYRDMTTRHFFFFLLTSVFYCSMLIKNMHVFLFNSRRFLNSKTRKSIPRFIINCAL